MAKFRAGDIVILKEFPKDLHPTFVKEMKEYTSKPQKIIRVCPYSRNSEIQVYTMENGFNWREDYMVFVENEYKVLLRRFKEDLAKISDNI